MAGNEMAKNKTDKETIDFEHGDFKINIDTQCGKIYGNDRTELEAVIPTTATVTINSNILRKHYDGTFDLVVINGVAYIPSCFQTFKGKGER